MSHRGHREKMKDFASGKEKKSSKVSHLAAHDVYVHNRQSPPPPLGDGGNEIGGEKWRAEEGGERK